MKIPVIVGPTASGKSAVALALALQAGGEIVNADSRQIYRELTAGTSKPGPEETAHVPHHLFGFLSARESYNAGLYARAAAGIIREIFARKKTPIVVGGTGLYLRALFDGLSQLPEKNEAVRRELLALAEAKGRHHLHEKLAELDPASAAKIPPQNIQRVVRALEVHAVTGKPLSEWHSDPPAKPSGLAPVFFGILWDRTALRKRIEERSRRIADGILEETRRLRDEGLGANAPGMESLGYRDAALTLRGELSRSEFLKRLITDTAQYAKRQMTWFRKDPRIRWIQATEPFDPEAAARSIRASML